MIEFPCHCAHRFSLPDEMAGSLVQCPRCGRLHDVPTHDELAHIAADGTYQIEVEPAEAPRLEQLRHVFGQRGGGDELDLRATMDDVRRAGQGDDPLQSAPAHPYPRPKYDPVTGQLIRPIEVKPDTVAEVDPASIPVARPAPLAYAAGDLPAAPGVMGILLRLMMSGGVITIFFVFVLHALAVFILEIGSMGTYLLYLAWPISLLLAMLIIAHYGCVVDETGPTERDELPRLFRDFEWHEDIWSPFTGFTGAVMLAYLPALLVLVLLPAPEPIFLSLAAALALLGSFFFPALLLTTLTSGTAVNLRPDRVLGVIRECGAGYLPVVVAWILTAGFYGSALLVLVTPAYLLVTGSAPALAVMAMAVPDAVLWPGLVVGIYLMHLFCWLTGRLYRGHQAHFPWAYQRHIPTRTGPADSRSRGAKI